MNQQNRKSIFKIEIGHHSSVVFPDDYNKSLALYDYRRVSPTRRVPITFKEKNFPLLLSLENRFPLLSESHQGFNPVLGRDHLENEEAIIGGE